MYIEKIKSNNNFKQKKTTKKIFNLCFATCSILSNIPYIFSYLNFNNKHVCKFDNNFACETMYRSSELNVITNYVYYSHTFNIFFSFYFVDTIAYK